MAGLGGIVLLDEDFNDVFDGEVPGGWTFEFDGEPPIFNDGYMTAADRTRPKHRWTDSVSGSAAELYSDGSGRHGGFTGQIMWAAWKGDASNASVYTPPLDFSNASAAAIVFDSNLKGNVRCYIDVVLEGQEPLNVLSMIGWDDDAVRITSETAIVAEAAGQRNVRFLFHTDNNARWTFDNVKIVALTDINLPAQPVAISPRDTLEFTSGSVQLRASAYNDPDGSAHASSVWQLALADAGLANPSIDETVTAGDLTSYAVQGLAPGHRYVWRVKYIAADGRASGWSLPVTFDLAIPASATLLLSEDFEGLSGQTPPANWTHVNNNVPGGVPEYDGWTYIVVDDWISLFGQERDLTPFAPGSTIALADSDEYEGGAQGFNSELITPVLNNVSGNSVLVTLISSYRHYDEQIGEINYSFDGGSTWLNLIRWDRSGYSDNEFAETTVAKVIPGSNTASQLKVMFKLYGSGGEGGTHSDNDWWWAIDDVRVYAVPEIVGVENWMLH